MLRTTSICSERLIFGKAKRLLAGPHTREASERRRVSASWRGLREPGPDQVPGHWPWMPPDTEQTRCPAFIPCKARPRLTADSGRAVGGTEGPVTDAGCAGSGWPLIRDSEGRGDAGREEGRAVGIGVSEESGGGKGRRKEEPD